MVGFPRTGASCKNRAESPVDQIIARK